MLNIRFFARVLQTSRSKNFLTTCRLFYTLCVLFGFYFSTTSNPSSHHGILHRISRHRGILVQTSTAKSCKSPVKTSTIWFSFSYKNSRLRMHQWRIFRIIRMADQYLFYIFLSTNIYLFHSFSLCYYV